MSHDIDTSRILSNPSDRHKYLTEEKLNPLFRVIEGTKVAKMRQSSFLHWRGLRASEVGRFLLEHSESVESPARDDRLKDSRRASGPEDADVLTRTYASGIPTRMAERGGRPRALPAVTSAKNASSRQLKA